MGQGGCVFASQLLEAVQHKWCDADTPKKKDVLASFGLVGRLHLESDWSESEVIAEICLTFSDNVTEDVQFQFLQFTGTGTKSLMVPKVSSSYKWTPKEVA